MLVAQTLDSFAAAQSQSAAAKVIKHCSRKWFDPDVVRVITSLAKRGELWKDIGSPNRGELVLMLDKSALRLKMGDEALDSICGALAQIVDAKSPLSFNHSNGVANASVTIARTLNLPRGRVVFVRHAALLHDLGKLGVSNTMLEKPANSMTKMESDEAPSSRYLADSSLNPAF